MSLFSSLSTQLELLADKVPLPWFTTLGAFIEEVIAPIPSPLVMTVSGSIAASQHQPLVFLGVLALIGAIGKTAGSWLVYVVSDKAEDLILNKFSKYIGISHQDIESIGKNLNHGRRDALVLTAMRAIPIFPTAPVSIVCGLIKVNMSNYLIGTFVGTFLRNIFYLYLGFSGLSTLKTFNEGLSSAEGIMQLILFVAFTAAFIWFYRRRSKGNVFQQLATKLQKTLTR